MPTMAKHMFNIQRALGSVLNNNNNKLKESFLFKMYYYSVCMFAYHGSHMEVRGQL